MSSSQDAVTGRDRCHPVSRMDIIRTGGSTEGPQMAISGGGHPDAPACRPVIGSALAGVAQ